MSFRIPLKLNRSSFRFLHLLRLFLFPLLFTSALQMFLMQHLEIKSFYSFHIVLLVAFQGLFFLSIFSTHFFFHGFVVFVAYLLLMGAFGCAPIQNSVSFYYQKSIRFVPPTMIPLFSLLTLVPFSSKPTILCNCIAFPSSFFPFIWRVLIGCSAFWYDILFFFFFFGVT
jgi:hypothetical protein